jgi:hypothetical protein
MFIKKLIKVFYLIKSQNRLTFQWKYFQRSKRIILPWEQSTNNAYFWAAELKAQSNKS